MPGRDSTRTRDRVLLQLERPSPRLPHASLSLHTRLTVAAIVHVAMGALLVLTPTRPASSTSDVTRVGLDIPRAPRLVFVAPPSATRSGGGGGGGNRGRGPAPRARAPASAARALPVARLPQADLTESVLQSPVQQTVLDATTLTAGASFVAGLPDAGSPVYSDARGPGDGTGFGDGEGSGAGSGTGPGAGSGTGGGAGGGPYRVGGSVNAPAVLIQVRPGYTERAVETKVQGSVTLELVVRENGVPDSIRVVRSLDPGGLDVEAVHAVRQWRFRPGHINGVPVDVLVTVVVNFHLY
jgi:protein TonB